MIPRLNGTDSTVWLSTMTVSVPQPGALELDNAGHGDEGVAGGTY